MAKSGTLYKSISLLIKWLIIILAFLFIYKRVFQNSQLSEMNQAFNSFGNSDLGWLCLAVILIPLNWGLEAFKWKLLISKIEEISFKSSFKSILAGITISVFTPNRTGEFGGRIFYLKSANRVQAVLLCFLGNSYQLLTTITAGCIAIIIQAKQFPELYKFVNFNLNQILLIVVFICLGLLFFIVFYFNRNKLLIKGKSLKSKLLRTILIVREFSGKEHLQFLILSVSRYIVFTFQFFILLYIFNVQVTLLDGFSMIAVSFLLMSAIPTIAFTEIGVRGSVSIALIGLLSSNTAGILAASFLLWIINIAAPAILGSLFVLRLQFIQSGK